MSRLHLNVGCGSNLIKGFVNVDRVAAPGVDLVHDLDTPWPWDDGSADRVEAKDVFEHVNDPVLFMTEAWRVLCALGTLCIRTPHWQHQDAYTDPTHKRFPTEHTFDYWIEGTVLHHLHNRFYGGVSFTREGMEMDGGSMIVILAKVEGQAARAVRGSSIDIDRRDGDDRHAQPQAARRVVGGAADHAPAAGELVPALAAAFLPDAEAQR